MRFKIIALFAIALNSVCFDCNVAQATDQDTAYVQILSDVPLAPGLSLDEESEVVFDVPEGKIVEVSAFGAADLAETQTFYKESLEALGWQSVPRKEWSYKRDEEFLEISFDDGENDLQVKFRLMPSSACSK
ncbi:MAG TPA: hypothetical protein DD412_00965 [Holosporales bacterium]|nr:hypothetical protein [Holosporales bacterium]